jgi:hypothetical protein
MELGKGVDHDLGQFAIGRWIVPASEQGRDGVTNHDSIAAVHHEEERAEDGNVVAVGESSGRLGKDAPQTGENPVLTSHIVGSGRNRAERRSPQHQLGPVGKGQEIGEVGLATGELLDERSALREIGNGSEPVDEAIDVETLVVSDWDDVAHRVEGIQQVGTAV